MEHAVYLLRQYSLCRQKPLISLHIRLKGNENKYSCKNISVSEHTNPWALWNCSATEMETHHWFSRYNFLNSSYAVWDMYCLLLFEHWDHIFEIPFRARIYVCIFYCIFIVLCRRDLAMDQSPQIGHTICLKIRFLN